MKKGSSIGFIILAIMLAAHGCTGNGRRSAPTPDLDTMIGQMIMVGFRGCGVDESSQVIKDIESGTIGGVILFDYDMVLQTNKRNISSREQVICLIGRLKAHSRYPLFVSIDQEGGKVCRLREEYGFPPTTSQKQLGLINREKTTRNAAAATAVLLEELGFNINFSPVVDVDLNPDNPVIGGKERSFSRDPAVVADHAGWMLDEYRARGIYGALKHFPGHGSSKDDSHNGLTDVTNTWNEIELEPYRHLIGEDKVGIIMTAHIFNSNLDARYPATLSKRILTDILRNRLAYRGIIITDDMNMKAVTDYYGFEESIELAVNAGADILLFANNLVFDEKIADRAFSTLKKLVAEGKIDRKRIEESFDRIMKLKSGTGRRTD